MERFLDFLFAIAWWQWLLGMSAIAGLYCLMAGQFLPFLKGVQDESEGEAERHREEGAAEERQHAAQSREQERRRYLKTIPSGPVEPVDLPPARVRVRNRFHPVAADADTLFGTGKDVAIKVMVRGVSRHHAKIRPEPRGYVLYDLMSSKGTLVDGEPVRSTVLAHGGRFRLGPVDVLFEETDSAEE